MATDRKQASVFDWLAGDNQPDKLGYVAIDQDRWLALVADSVCYTVVEHAGCMGENDACSFATWREACAWMRDTYEADELEDMCVCIRKDYPDGEQTYDF